MNTIRFLKRQRGFNLLEIVVAIAVFAIGMLALGSLQGALSRSMADARMRTTAANIAEEEIESLRAFVQLISDGTNLAYNDIADSTTTATVDGVAFTVTRNVTDYYYTLSSDSFSTTTNGQASSTYKQVDVTVAWDGANRNFRGSSEGTEITAATLGTGSIRVTSTIPALITSASAKVSDEVTSSNLAPPVSYQPGQNPDVVALSLGNNKFKESLLPVPDVIRTDELVETTFDVITYSSNNSGSQFLRREEFTTVSCECNLKAASADSPGRRPVVWAGDEYAGGHFVTKQYGESANNQQSDLCDACCRDHHDGGSSADDNSGDAAYNRYGPFKTTSEYSGGSFANNHLHYKSDAETVAGVGDEYLEACRMVRVDGFYRVMQDFRQEDRYIFPADYLDEESEINYYSDYVTGATASYTAATYDNYSIAATPPCIGAATGCVTPQPVMQGAYPTAISYSADSGDAEQLPSWSQLPFGVDSDPTQQLRSRGIYIDYISKDLRTVITCLNGGGTAESCTSGDVILDQTGSVDVLEMVPFFDVQNTFLARWGETPANTPVETTNDALRDNNTHSRGVISRDATAQSSTVSVVAHRGNLGFTDTVAIDPLYSSHEKSATLVIQSLDDGGGGGDPPPVSGTVISGSFFETVPGNPNFSITESGDVACNQTGAAYDCTVDSDATSATITLTDYGKRNTDRVACGDGLTTLSQTTEGANASTTFQLFGLAAGSSYHITIYQATSCPS